MASIQFPEGFLWGAATAAYQIEGAANEGGRGQSIWDTFCRQPGRVRDGATGEVACDHYHRVDQDIALMRDLGLQAYRFSVAWPRVYPFGGGPLNEEGLAFYDRLVDGLLDAGIDPMMTLYHWDLPQALQDRGGWANRDIVEHFETYARTLFERFRGRVHRWVTLNEPLIVSQLGHLAGVLAPGIRSHEVNARVIHHLLLAHGKAVEMFRELDMPGEIGITNANTAYEPYDESSEHLAACELARDFDSRLFHDPIYGRGYPASVHKFYAERGAPFPIEPGDLPTIATPTDFLGVNNYSRRVVMADRRPIGFRFAEPTLPVQPMGYEEAPDSLGDFVRWVSKEYDSPPIYITENGRGDEDGTEADMLNDQKRIELMRGFLAGLHDAIESGCDVRGYYAWSLMDNFEWAFGYSKRFGLVYTDYETLERKPKASARFYADVIRDNGLTGAT